MDIFKFDSRFMQTLGKIWDLMWLNLLTGLCCLPVLTIGPALTAMHHVLTEIVLDQETSVTKSFFHGFRQDFGKSVGMWLLFLGTGAILAADYDMLFIRSSENTAILTCLFLVAAALWLMTFSWVFALLGRYQNSFGASFKNAMQLALSHPFVSLAMAFFWMVPFLLLSRWKYALLFMILFGYTGPGVLGALLYCRIFARIEKEQEEAV